MRGIKEQNIVKIISTSFKTFYKNYHWALLIVLVDLMFLFVLGGVMTIVQVIAIDHLSAMMQMGGEATGGLANVYQDPAVITGLNDLSADAQFNYHMRSLVKYLAIMVLAGYVCWTLFQGLSWWLSNRLNGKRQSYLRYMKNFALQSLLFYGGFVVLMVLWVRMFMASQMAIVPWMSRFTLDIIFWVLAGAWWYFGFWSYTMRHKYAYQNIREAFVFGVKKFFHILPTLMSVTILFVIIDFLLKIPFIAGNNIIMLLFGILLLMPAFTYTRLLLIETRMLFWPEVREMKVHHKEQVHAHHKVKHHKVRKKHKAHK